MMDTVKFENAGAQGYDLYRYTRNENSCANPEIGYMMFTDDVDKVIDCYGENGWTVRSEDLTNVEDLYDMMSEIAIGWGLLEYAYDYAVENNGFEGEYEDYVRQNIAQHVNPDVIVDGACLWDDQKEGGILGQALLDNGVKGFKTHDGAIVLDESIIAKMTRPED